MASDAPQRLDAGVRKNRAPLRRPQGILLDYGGAELLLAGEMVVERPLGDAGRLRDVLHRGRVEAPAMQRLKTGRKYVVV